MKGRDEFVIECSGLSGAMPFCGVDGSKSTGKETERLLRSARKEKMKRRIGESAKGDLGLGIWDLGFGIWDLGFGIWEVASNLRIASVGKALRSQGERAKRRDGETEKRRNGETSL